MLLYKSVQFDKSVKMSNNHNKGIREIMKNIFADRERSHGGSSGQTKEEKERERDRKRNEEIARKIQKKKDQDLEKRKKDENEMKLEWKQDWKQEEDRERKREQELQRRNQDKFNDDFERSMHILEHKICQLNFRSKTTATMWMTKLRSAKGDDSEIRARNIIAGHLVKCCNDGIFLKEPFNQAPPPENLATLRQKMNLTRDTPCRSLPLKDQKEPDTYLLQLFQESYDGGEFLSQLPVPRDGAFFVLHMRPNL